MIIIIVPVKCTKNYFCIATDNNYYIASYILRVNNEQNSSYSIFGLLSKLNNLVIFKIFKLMGLGPLLLCI